MSDGIRSESADNRSDLVIHPVGRVESTLIDLDAAPQRDEGAPDAWLQLDPLVQSAAADLNVESEIVVLTWLHRADRATLAVHPRGDESRPLTGVFSTRSPDRQSDRVASCPGSRRRRRPNSGQPSRGSRRHADRRYQTGARATW